MLATIASIVLIVFMMLLVYFMIELDGMGDTAQEIRRFRGRRREFMI
tara:strand:+ start:51 stop:191 length:141 start_codon:yes stop_codon:yes gene_type:complete